MTSTTDIEAAGAVPRRRLFLGLKASELLTKALTTLILAVGTVIILIPLLNMISYSLKDVSQLREYTPRLIPTAPTTVEIDGKDEPLYRVTIEGEERKMALVKNRPEGKGLFVDPTSPEEIYALVIEEQVPVRHLEIHWENYPEALTAVPFGRYALNTCIITFVSMAGVLISCTLVAYGFSRFRARGLNTLFLVLLSTIVLPPQVTLIPLYVFFQRLGWVDTFLPLIVPAFFANAWDVFVLRQFFMTVLLELDDAARIDGVSPLQVFWHIMLPPGAPGTDRGGHLSLFVVLEQFLRTPDLPAQPGQLDRRHRPALVQCAVYLQHASDHGRIGGDDHTICPSVLLQPAYLHPGGGYQRHQGLAI